jgi:hypothetical protein
METVTQINKYESTRTERDEYGDRTKPVAGFEIVTTEQQIFLMIEDESSCCESWGYFWCNDDTAEFIGATLLGVTRVDEALNTHKVKQETPDLSNDDPSGIGTMFVNIETDRGVLQFVAYNSHNGYYGHRAIVECKQLNHSETL